ncbi:MAG TPA: tetratricopeptide repeat protein [Gemmatimonadaceae bacterium]|nr:tetratricopeptide repeat protein [Gemmatimonadaceae bacterium]
MFRTAGLVALLAGAAPLAAQVTPAPARPDSARPAATAPAGDSTATAATAKRDTAVVPVADQARGVDAEIRVALYELMDDRYIPALTRLQWLSTSPVALTDGSANTALRGREDLAFLLSQSYYRLGMDSAFRATATPLLGSSSSARFGRLLRSQLLLDAYRHGDFAAAIRMASTIGPEDQGLATLVAGLAAYQSGDIAGAKQRFATARASAAPYGQYAQYMEALTTLRSDTTQRAAAVTALETLASTATGELQDQVRLTAAEVAYEGERYDDAARLAGEVSPSSGLAAQALLTRAWALYKGNNIAAAGQAFDEFATRYPQLPERDESRLMAGQALLQLGRTSDAATVFRTVADSAASESRSLQARAQGSMSQAARALVQARAAGFLFVNDPANGKTIALDDAAGSERQVLAAAFGDSATNIVPAVSAAEIISLDDVARRFDALAPAGELPRRVVFAPASATKNPQDFAARSQALYAADAAVVVAQHTLAELLASQQRQIALLQQLQTRLNADADMLSATATKLTAARDSLARLAVALDAASVRLRQMFVAQINTTRMMANENRASLDSVKSVLAGAQGTPEYTLLDTESQTAAAYLQLADIIERGLDTALGHHPVFARRDSVNAHSQQLATLLGESQSALAAARQAVTDEITRLQGGGSDRARSLQATLAAAESRRTAAENSLVGIVDAELRARATEMIASLKRDTEAAEFGSASASFFQAIDAGQTPTAGTTSSASIAPTRAAATGADAAANRQSQPQQK